jgi:AcrR family transcriptional regulator
MSRLPAEKRREQLLDRAANLFSKLGYARATTAELAKAAGVTEPIIYRHFASKRDLFIALIERTGEETLRQWEEALADAPDPADRLVRLLAGNPMVSERGRSAYRVILQAITEVEDPLIHTALSEHMTRLHAFLVKEIQHAQAGHKVTARYSAEIIAWILMHVGLGYGVLSAMNIPNQGMDKEGNHVQDVLGRLLVGRAGEHKPEGA